MNTSLVGPQGLLLINKEPMLSSHAMLQKLKRLYQAKKLGHTGSLDPLATGMLPLCFGEATKFCQYLLEADKAYEVTACLGVTTDTGDACGQITAKREFRVCQQEEIQTVLESLRGQIEQVPPMFSALKHQGRPLYYYARAGVEIPRVARSIHIYELQLLEFIENKLRLRVVCSKGTYIRSLVEEIGERLNLGAHVTQLHRSYVAPFKTEKMYHFSDLEHLSREELLHCLIPMDSALQGFYSLTLEEADILKLQQGQTVHIEEDSDTQGEGFAIEQTQLETEIEALPLQAAAIRRLYRMSGEFIGLGVFQTPQILKAKRLLRFAS